MELLRDESVYSHIFSGSWENYTQLWLILTYGVIQYW